MEDNDLYVGDFFKPKLETTQYLKLMDSHCVLVCIFTLRLIQLFQQIADQMQKSIRWRRTCGNSDLAISQSIHQHDANMCFVHFDQSLLIP